MNAQRKQAGKSATSTVDFDGVTYPLAFDFNAIADTEPETGANLLLALHDIGNLSGRQLRGLFLAAVRAADPASKMTIDEAGELIRIDTIFPVTEAIAKTIIASMSAKTESAADEPEAA